MPLRFATSPVLPPPDSLRRAAVDSLMQSQCPGYTSVRVSRLVFIGNDVTKERVLRAELDIQEGDTLAVATLTQRLEDNRGRLVNLRLFNQVLVQPTCTNGELIVAFVVQERWYTIPVPTVSLADRTFRAWYDRPDKWRRIDYGIYVVRYNFRGRNEEIRGNLQHGFNRKYELFYITPRLGHSRVGLSAGASFYHSHALDVTTTEDRLRAFRDDNGFPIRRWYATAGLRWRSTVQRLTTAELFYYNESISNSAFEQNSEYFLGQTHRQSVDLIVSRTLNQRNSFAYPLTGRYLQLSLTQRLFLRHASPPVTTLLGRYARYVDLKRQLYYSFSLEGRLRLANRLAFADSRALGFGRALVRGYDAYVVDGRHYGVFRQGISWRIFDAGRLRLPLFNDPRIGTVPLQLYLNTFTDAGFVGERSVPATNRLPNQFLASAGIGLHLVTFYDRVFTVEYAQTRHGFGGVFFRTDFPI